MPNHNSPCIFEEVTRVSLSRSRANAWENIAEDALRKEWEVFGLERLNKHQEEALRLVVESKRDVFVNLPAGFGKSVEEIFYLFAYGVSDLSHLVVLIIFETINDLMTASCRLLLLFLSGSSQKSMLWRTLVIVSRVSL